MANNTHFTVLRQGAVAWNTWREAHPDIAPDLSHANLQRLDLDRFSFEHTDLSHALFSSSSLLGSNFQHADLRHANLNDALCGSADFSYANLYKAKLANANLSEASLVSANFQNALLSDADVRDADFSHANFNRAVLSGADLSESNLTLATFQQSILPNANLKGTILRGTNFTEAYLAATNFSYAHFEKTLFHSATIGWTQFNDVALHELQGLETVAHIGPSEVSLSTLYHSPHLSETFLRGVGIPESWLSISRTPPIALVPVSRCFICYCEADQTFAAKLQTDLHKVNIRCWLSLLHSDIGIELDDFRKESFVSLFSHYTNQFDQIVLILSEEALEEDAVQMMIRDTLNKEQQIQQSVLFPLILDKSVLNTEVVTNLLAQSKNHIIHDFYNWTDTSIYQQIFTELCQDLQKINSWI